MTRSGGGRCVDGEGGAVAGGFGGGVGVVGVVGFVYDWIYFVKGSVRGR